MTSTVMGTRVLQMLATSVGTDEGYIVYDKAVRSINECINPHDTIAGPGMIKYRFDDFIITLPAKLDLSYAYYVSTIRRSADGTTETFGQVTGYSSSPLGKALEKQYLTRRVPDKKIVRDSEYTAIGPFKIVFAPNVSIPEFTGTGSKTEDWIINPGSRSPMPSSS
jgi:hypothetical protein